jgi:hypothetical protein
MFTLGSGQYVHQAETVAEMVVYAGSRKARTMSSVAPDFPAPLAAVIDRALAFDRTERFRNAREMRRALLEAFETCFGVGLPPGPLVALAVPASEPKLTQTADAHAETIHSSGPALPPLMKASTTAGLSDDRSVARRSRAPLFAALGVGAAAIIGVGVVVVVSSSHGDSPRSAKQGVDTVVSASMDPKAPTIDAHGHRVPKTGCY